MSKELDYITELERKNRLLSERCNQLLKDKGDLTDQIADIKANCDLAIEGRDVKIMELEQKLEQTEKDLLGRYDGFLAGLKAGRPQWHKVADGDYPDTDRTVLAYSDDVVSGHYPYFAQYYKGFTNAKKNGVDLNWNCWRNNMQRELVEPTVWCEIPTFDKE